MNEEIFEACSVIVRKFFCIKYSKKKFAGD
jgi:hypothetical protein